jgi:hypothetical protein
VSVAVALDELGRRVDEYGPTPFLITTGASGAHVVSVAVAFDGRRFELSAGRTSRANVQERPVVTLLWSNPSGGPYGLIVDGTARAEGDLLVVEPSRAVLHRLADAAADLPSCVPIEQPD